MFISTLLRSLRSMPSSLFSSSRSNFSRSMSTCPHAYCPSASGRPAGWPRSQCSSSLNIYVQLHFTKQTPSLSSFHSLALGCLLPLLRIRQSLLLLYLLVLLDVHPLWLLVLESHRLQQVLGLLLLLLQLPVPLPLLLFLLLPPLLRLQVLVVPPLDGLVVLPRHQLSPIITITNLTSNHEMSSKEILTLAPLEVTGWKEPAMGGCFSSASNIISYILRLTYYFDRNYSMMVRFQRSLNYSPLRIGITFFPFRLSFTDSTTPSNNSQSGDFSRALPDISAGSPFLARFCFCLPASASSMMVFLGLVLLRIETELVIFLGCEDASLAGFRSENRGSAGGDCCCCCCCCGGLGSVLIYFWCWQRCWWAWLIWASRNSSSRSSSCPSAMAWLSCVLQFSHFELKNMLVWMSSCLSRSSSFLRSIILALICCSLVLLLSSLSSFCACISSCLYCSISWASLRRKCPCSLSLSYSMVSSSRTRVYRICSSFYFLTSLLLPSLCMANTNNKKRVATVETQPRCYIYYAQVRDNRRDRRGGLRHRLEGLQQGHPLPRRHQGVQGGRRGRTLPPHHPARDPYAQDAQGRLRGRHQGGLQEEGQDLPHLRVLLTQPAQPHRELINKVVYKIIKCLQYLHSKNIIHRDVKPQNILLNQDYSLLKICDFGFARFMPEKDYDLTEYVATRWYRSPELLVGEPYGKAADLWAVGCMIGELVDGQPMFPGDDEVDQLHLITKAVGSLTQKQVDHFENNPKFASASVPSPKKTESLQMRYLGLIQKNALNFMKACLRMNSDQRLTVEQALKHPYLLKYSLEDNQFQNDEQNLLSTQRKNQHMKNDSKASLISLKDDEERVIPIVKGKLSNSKIGLRQEGGSLVDHRVMQQAVEAVEPTGLVNKKKSHTNLHVKNESLEPRKQPKVKKLTKMMSEEKNLKVNVDLNVKINLKIHEKSKERQRRDVVAQQLDHKLNTNANSNSKGKLLPEIRYNQPQAVRGQRHPHNTRHQKLNNIIRVIGESKELIRNSRPSLVGP